MSVHLRVYVHQSIYISKNVKNKPKVHFADETTTDTCVFELCCSPNSTLGKVSHEYNIPHIRAHKGDFNLMKKADCEDLKAQIAGVKR